MCSKMETLEKRFRRVKKIGLKDHWSTDFYHRLLVVSFWIVTVEDLRLGSI